MQRSREQEVTDRLKEQHFKRAQTKGLIDRAKEREVFMRAIWLHSDTDEGKKKKRNSICVSLKH